MTIPTGSYDAGQRLAEVLVEGQLEDRVRQLQRRPEDVEHERREDRERGDRRREARADEAADGQPDAAQAHDGQPDDEDADGRRHDVARPGDAIGERHEHRHRDRGDQRSRRSTASPDWIIQVVRRTGRRQDQVGAAAALVARPARHEERAEEAEDHRGEPGEGQLQEAGWLGEVDRRGRPA